MSGQVWMPHAGHFVGGMNCSFHLNTYVNGYIVSTVGEYRPSFGRSASGVIRETGGGEVVARRDDDPLEKIGLDRLYETMVFKGGPTKWDDDYPISRRCCPFEAQDLSEIDFAPYNDPGDAYRGHLVMLDKYEALGPRDGS